MSKTASEYLVEALEKSGVKRSYGVVGNGNSLNGPYDVAMTGLVGFASGYAAMRNCEALLMLGADFPYRAFLWPIRA